MKLIEEEIASIEAKVERIKTRLEKDPPLSSTESRELTMIGLAYKRAAEYLQTWLDRGVHP